MANIEAFGGNIKEIVVKQIALAKALGLSDSRIRKMVSEGIVIKAPNNNKGGVLLFDSLKNYFELSKKKIANDNPDYMAEKAEHEQVKKEMSIIKLAKQRGELYEAKTVEFVMQEIYTVLRNQLSGIPSKVAPRLDESIRGEVYELMTSEIESCLSELAQFSPEMFISEEEDIETE